MSKGHAGPAMYAALALKGFFPMEELETLNKPGTRLPSHTDMTKTPGVDMTTGSLGQGMSSATGMALAGKLDNKDHYVYCLLGDGEIDEGQCYEAFQFAAQQNLDNLIVFLDKNDKQLDDTTDKCLSLRDINAKLEAFGWDVHDVKDGHDVAAICEAVEASKAAKGKPSFITLHTIKGKDFPQALRIPNNPNMPVTMDNYKEACELLDKQIAELG